MTPEGAILRLMGSNAGMKMSTKTINIKVGKVLRSAYPFPNLAPILDKLADQGRIDMADKGWWVLPYEKQRTYKSNIQSTHEKLDYLVDMVGILVALAQGGDTKDGDKPDGDSPLDPASPALL